MTKKKLHAFDPSLARQFGLADSIILHNLIFWTEKKLSNGDAPADDGLLYIYNSIKTWAEIFDYLGAGQIRGVFSRLEKAGVISARSDLNKFGFDKTKHYAITEKWLPKLLKSTFVKNANPVAENANPVAENANPVAENANPVAENCKPIPDSKQQIVNSDSKQQIVNSDNLPAAKAAAPAFAAQAIEILNSILGTRYKPATKETARNLKALEKEKVTLEQIRQVINYKKLDWGADLKMREFLRPSTLLRPSNFFNYLEASENQPLNYQKTGVETLEDFDRKNQARVERIKQMTPTTSIGKTLLGEDFFND